MKQNLVKLGSIISREQAKKLKGGLAAAECSGKCFNDAECTGACRCKYKSTGGSSVCISGFGSSES